MTRSSRTHQTLETSARPEIELLLCCGRTDLDPERMERVKALVKENLNWDYLIQTALRHGMMPLLYSKLRATCPDLVPKDQLSHLNKIFQHNTAHNLLLTGELCKILKLFAANGIIAIPYKGPAVAVSIYHDLALRQFADLDILIRKRDFSRAQQLLIGEGYQPHFNIKEDQEAAFISLGYVQSFARDHDQSIIELHWAIASRFFSFPLEIEGLWERLTPVKLIGEDVLVPSPDDMVLILCVHGAKDLWERLEWICGIAELTRSHKEIDWEHVLRQARELRSERMLLLGLFLADDLFGAEFPEKVSQRIEATPRLKPLAAQVRRRLFQEDVSPPSLSERVLFHLSTREHLRDRIRYCFRLAMTTTPVDWELLTLPRSLYFIYPLLRPLRLLKKYGFSVSKHL